MTEAKTKLNITPKGLAGTLDGTPLEISSGHVITVGADKVEEKQSVQNPAHMDDIHIEGFISEDENEIRVRSLGANVTINLTSDGGGLSVGTNGHVLSMPTGSDKTWADGITAEINGNILRVASAGRAYDIDLNSGDVKGRDDVNTRAAAPAIIESYKIVMSRDGSCFNYNDVSVERDTAGAFAVAGGTLNNSNTNSNKTETQNTNPTERNHTMTEVAQTETKTEVAQTETEVAQTKPKEENTIQLTVNGAGATGDINGTTFEIDNATGTVAVAVQTVGIKLPAEITQYPNDTKVIVSKTLDSLTVESQNLVNTQVTLGLDGVDIQTKAGEPPAADAPKTTVSLIDAFRKATVHTSKGDVIIQLGENGAAPRVQTKGDVAATYATNTDAERPAISVEENTLHLTLKDGQKIDVDLNTLDVLVHNNNGASNGGEPAPIEAAANADDIHIAISSDASRVTVNENSVVRKSDGGFAAASNNVVQPQPAAETSQFAGNDARNGWVYAGPSVDKSMDLYVKAADVLNFKEAKKAAKAAQNAGVDGVHVISKGEAALAADRMSVSDSLSAVFAEASYIWTNNRWGLAGIPIPGQRATKGLVPPNDGFYNGHVKDKNATILACNVPRGQKP